MPGGAGAGKSHVIPAFYLKAIRTLLCEGEKSSIRSDHTTNWPMTKGEAPLPNSTSCRSSSFMRCPWLWPAVGYGPASAWNHFEQRIICPGTTNYPADPLHVFGCNDKVDQFNQRSCQSYQRTHERKWQLTEKCGMRKDYRAKSDPRYTGGLPETLTVRVGVRGMLTRYLNVTDGLVNGALGTMVCFIEYVQARSQLRAILVEFDQVNVEAAARQRTSFNIWQHLQAVAPIDVKRRNQVCRSLASSSQ